MDRNEITRIILGEIIGAIASKVVDVLWSLNDKLRHILLLFFVIGGGFLAYFFWMGSEHRSSFPVVPGKTSDVRSLSSDASIPVVSTHDETLTPAVKVSADDEPVSPTSFIEDKSPVITITTPEELPDGVVGREYEGVQLTAEGSEKITWQNEEDLPDGLTLSSDGSIHGTPTQEGRHTFAVKASNGNESASKTFTLNIMGSNTPVIITITTPERLPDGVVGREYEDVRLTTEGSEKITWQNEEGLPDGLSLSPDGFIYGTPTKEGTYTFEVKASAGDESASQTFTISIAKVSTPVITIITPEKLTDGVVGRGYEGVRLTTEGAEKITWQNEDDLPDGLSLFSDGTIRGTPTQDGTYTFAVKASAGNKSISKTFTINVRVEWDKRAELRVSRFTLTADKKKLELEYSEKGAKGDKVVEHLTYPLALGDDKCFLVKGVKGAKRWTQITVPNGWLIDCPTTVKPLFGSVYDKVTNNEGRESYRFHGRASFLFKEGDMTVRDPYYRQ